MQILPTDWSEKQTTNQFARKHVRYGSEILRAQTMHAGYKNRRVTAATMLLLSTIKPSYGTAITY